MAKITVKNTDVNVIKVNGEDYICLTDMLQAKAGRYGGTYAHKDIAFEFAMWISPEFKVYIVKDMFPWQKNSKFAV